MSLQDKILNYLTQNKHRWVDIIELTRLCNTEQHNDLVKCIKLLEKENKVSCVDVKKNSKLIRVL